MELIGKYSNFYYRELRCVGFNVSHDEVLSELGFVYANALNRFRETKRGCECGIPEGGA